MQYIVITAIRDRELLWSHSLNSTNLIKISNIDLSNVSLLVMKHIDIENFNAEYLGCGEFNNDFTKPVSLPRY